MYIKKALLIWFAVVAIVALMPAKVKAETAPNGNEYEYKYNVHNYGRGRDYTLYSNYPCGLYLGTQGLQNQYRCCIQKDDGLYTIDTVYGVYAVSRTLVYGMADGGSGTFDLSDVCIYQGSGAPDGGMPIYANTTECPISANSYSVLFQSLKDSVVDYEHIYYDSSIPTPIFTVSYTENISSVPRMPISVNLTNATNDLYAYVRMDSYVPSFVGIDTKGEYEAYAYDRLETYEIVSKQSKVLSTALPQQVLSEYIADAWSDQITDYITNNTNRPTWNGISPDSDFVNSTLFTSRKMMYNTTLRKIGCFYGNNHEISVQYFRIEDGKVYAGEIKTWTNQNGGYFSVSFPTYYVPYNPANGFEVITIERPNEEEEQDVTLPDNQYGTKTGLTININNGSLVPNYPDYPTVATYNLDNILVSTIDNAKHLGGFFTEVAGFCAATFAWIPQEIWQIIALGFALSIVVMFVKIL